MKKILFAICCSFSLLLMAQETSIIPAPVSVQLKKGQFILNKNTVIVHDELNKTSADFFNAYLNDVYGFTLAIAQSAKENVIRFNTSRFIQKAEKEERYTLTINTKSIEVIGDGAAGTFYGMQSLIQLLPVSNSSKSISFRIPCLAIEDQPRFAYRGMHLDVSRHFFPISYIKKYIDYIALHKMNYFHWHLTDDQGWRIEIKKYPLLTEIGGWRDGTIIGRFPGTGNDNIRHGGFYTQEEAKEIVRYAAARHITVLPEIEMPGHSMAVLAAYPEYSTTPTIRPKVPMTWGLNGVENNVFAPTDKTFSFLEDVLTEVMDIFPSKLIHIGGDECSKIWWKKDSFSQQLMREKGLKNEDELQSWFIQRIEKFVNSKGRTIIGWDEILEGGLAPNAVVMSWTGEQGGIHAAKEKHQVVMTPGGWCYFDHMQSKNEDSVTIGGYTTVEKVYSYEPIPKQLTEEEGKFIMGAQGNVWTEYMAYPSKIEYMIFPRMSALSEVLWSPKEKRNWNDFEKRLLVQFNRYHLWKANYSKAYFDINDSILPVMGSSGNSIMLKLDAKNRNFDFEKIFPYQPSVKNHPEKIKMPYTTTINPSGGTLLVIGKQNGKEMVRYTKSFSFNKATGKSITIKPQPSSSYPGDGAFTLVNGVQNTRGRERSSEFIGYSGNHAEAIIDLGKPEKINTVIVHAFESQASWIYRPSQVILLGSTDGSNYQQLGLSSDFQIIKGGNGKLVIKLEDKEARYLKFEIKNFGKIPEGNPGAGKGAWMFLHEIEVH